MHFRYPRRPYREYNRLSGTSLRELLTLFQILKYLLYSEHLRPVRISILSFSRKPHRCLLLLLHVFQPLRSANQKSETPYLQQGKRRPDAGRKRFLREEQPQLRQFQGCCPRHDREERSYPSAPLRSFCRTHCLF